MPRVAEADVYDRLRTFGSEVTLRWPKAFTTKTLPAVRDGRLQAVDFILFDGRHSIETISNQCEYRPQLLSSNGACICDGYYSNPVKGGLKNLIDSLERDQWRDDFGETTLRKMNS